MAAPCASIASLADVPAVDHERGVGHAEIVVEYARGGGIAHPQAVVDDERVAVMAFGHRGRDRPHTAAAVLRAEFLMGRIPAVEVSNHLYLPGGRRDEHELHR